MKPVKEALGEADRSKVVDDVVKLIDAEVARKGGLSGMALKGGYKVVKKLKGGRMIHRATDHMLDDFTEAIAPLHEDFVGQGGQGSFSDYLRKNDTAATNALLNITDRRAAKAENQLMKKTYAKLRPQAVTHVKDALPGLGRLIDKYTQD